MLKRDPAVRGLSAFESLQTLPKKELRALARAGKEVEHAPGSVIIEQGAGAAALHVVLAGSARVEIGGQQVSSLAPGDVFGEMAFLEGAPRSASIVAETSVRLHSVAAWNVPSLLDAAPALKAMVLAQMRARRGD